MTLLKRPCRFIKKKLAKFSLPEFLNNNNDDYDLDNKYTLFRCFECKYTTYTFKSQAAMRAQIVCGCPYTTIIDHPVSLTIDVT